MPRREIEALYAHMEWADATLWEAVLDRDAAADDERLRKLLVHVHTVQWVYLGLWRGEPFSPPETGHFASLAEVRDWAREYYGGLRTFLEDLEERALDGPVEFPWADQLAEHLGTVHPSSLRETLLQVPAHTGHHRGQLMTRLRQLGGEPPLVDFIAWVWMGKPAPPATWSGATT